MSDHKRVVDPGCYEIQVPAKVFLSCFFIGPDALVAQLADYPPGHIIAETTGINEVIPRFRHVESCAFEGDDRPDF